MATTSTTDCTTAPRPVDFHIRIEGSIVLFWAETAEAVAWWAEHVDDCAPSFCGAHVVEHRYAPDIISALAELGFILKGGR